MKNALIITIISFVGIALSACHAGVGLDVY
jgi:hypothetical protein